MEVNRLIDNAKFGEITVYLGNFAFADKNILPKASDQKVVEYFKEICDLEKLVKALPVLDIKENVLNVKMNELSNSLKNKLAVVEALVSKENTFVFNNINKSLSYREIGNLKRVLKKLAEHNKKVIIISNDVEFLFGLTKMVYVIKNDEIIDMTPVDWFNKDLYEYVAMPPIIEFVMNCQKRGIKIDNCYETKELLKAIYRSVDK